MFFFGHDVLYYFDSLIMTVFTYYYIMYGRIIVFIFKRIYITNQNENKYLNENKKTTINRLFNGRQEPKPLDERTTRAPGGGAYAKKITMKFL
jgi:hypothetical protein